MPLFRRKTYDRSRSLAQAARAKSRGNPAKAVARYREVLAHEPANADVHRRIAPLLAATKQPEDAWSSYRVAVSDLMTKGFVDQAIGVLREAARCLGKDRRVWEQLAVAESERKRPIDAVQALLEGSRRFRRRRDLPDAVRLLVAARKLAPNHFDANFELAGLLPRVGAAGPARTLLEELAARSAGRSLRRVRARQLRLQPSPGTLWRWLWACLGRR